MELSKKITELRKSRGWTQAELADRMGMSASHVSRWEHGHAQPRQAAIDKLVEIFGVEREVLVSEERVGPAQLSHEDPELAELVAQIPRLKAEQRYALRLVLRSMLTCEQLEHLVAQGR